MIYLWYEKNVSQDGFGSDKCCLIKYFSVAMRHSRAQLYLNHSLGATDFQNLPASFCAIRESQVDDLRVPGKLEEKKGGKP